MKYNEEWQKTLRYVGSNGKEINTFAIRNIAKKYFMVKICNRSLKVSKAKILEPSCKINKERTISYNQFEEIYDLYNRYINKEKGVRAQMSKHCENSTYILSIIHEVL